MVRQTDIVTPWAQNRAFVNQWTCRAAPLQAESEESERSIFDNLTICHKIQNHKENVRCAQVLTLKGKIKLISSLA